MTLRPPLFAGESHTTEDEPDLYLILHKVRGKPAMDIAHPLAIGKEIGWIIPTSGHRAYPWRHWRLDELMDTSDINSHGCHDYPHALLERDLPTDLPDHYQVEQPAPIRAKIGTARSALGPKLAALNDDEMANLIKLIEESQP